ncbi:MAG: NADH-quinone oxidoreductase subunit N [Myxococcota bacterium]
MNVTSSDWAALAPALVVLASALLVVGLDIALRPGTRRSLLVLLSLVGIAIPAGLLTQRLVSAAPAIRAFGGALVLDDLAAFLSVAILAATGLLLVGAEVDTRRRRIAFGEYYALVLTSAASMMLLVASNDFLMMFLNLEILSLALYVLTGITRRNPRSNEASVKYLVTGAFATGFLLMGVAFVYGAAGAIDLAGIGLAIAQHGSTPLLDLGLGLVLVGFGFKIGAVPFHMWVPDVYEGAPTTTTAFMSVTVKAAGVGALIRMLLIAFPARAELWGDLLWWMAVATMILGNLIALQQRSVKRMLAYSSVAHTGYALVAVATMANADGTVNPAGAAGALMYLMVYTFMTFGAFMMLVYMGHEVEVPGHDSEWQDAENIDDLAGMGATHPWAALASLRGKPFPTYDIPPPAGFFGKFTLFAAAVSQGDVTIAVIGVMASLVSLYYYLRVVVTMYMQDPVTSDEKVDKTIGLSIALATIGTLALGVQPALFWEWAARSIGLLAG